MTPARWPITALGLALGGLAGVGLWMALDAKSDQAETAAAATSHRSRLPSIHGRAGGPAHASRVESSSTMSEGESSRAEFPAAPPPLPSVRRRAIAASESMTEEQVWAHYQPTPEELAYRAFKAEQSATKELENLLQVLNLTEDQQDRVFAALARTSPHYHPSLQLRTSQGGTLGTAVRESGTPGPASPLGAESGSPVTGDTESSAATEAAAVLAELTPEQADVYERYASERDAFWVGVVEDIETKLNQSP